MTHPAFGYHNTSHASGQSALSGGPFTAMSISNSKAAAEMATLEASISHYQRKISQEPNCAAHYFQLANVARQAGQLPIAADAYIKGLALEPGSYKTYGLLANLLTSLGRYNEALQYYAMALQAAPSPMENVDTLYHLGELYKRMRVFAQALECYDYVLQLQPEHPAALLALSQIYRQQGKTQQAIQLYDRLLALKPDDASLLISSALALPIVYESTEAIEQWRTRLEAKVEHLTRQDFKPDPSLALHGSTFYLSYQGKQDRPLVEKIGTMIQKLLPPTPELKVVAKAKPRIGIVSRYLVASHTIGKLMQGIIQHLSREQFEVVVFSVGQDSAYTPDASAHPEDRYVILPADNIQKAACKIAEESPDILFYADIGMNIATYCLSAMRLAPVQCVTWGHPVTTGLSTMDYFISSGLIEPDNAQAHYSERLVQLESLPTYYYRPQPVDLPDLKSTRRQFGMDENAHVYLCPQSLYKFHPDFDGLLKGILERDPAGILVLLSHYAPEINQQLLQRFQTTMPDCMERVVMLPRLDQTQFFQLLACADVMLDPLHFGGGNTTYEAFSQGVPIVTWPSHFMRSRLTAGCYQKMEISDYIARNAHEYIDLAVALGTNPLARQQAKAQILDRCSVLYEDKAMIRELEAFFLQAFAQANSKEAVMPEPLAFLREKRLPLKNMLQQAPCPACGYHVAVSFYHGGDAPLTTLAWPKSTEQAQAMQKLPLNFVRCVDCGHVYNRDFSYENVPYSDKPNLMYNQGALWQEHLQITHGLILDRLPARPIVIEIGAGDGHFLKAIARQRPQGRYVAFDPSGALDTSDGLVEFFAELFDPTCHMSEFKPDLIICRHMLEHLENPLGFVQALSFAAEWEGLQTDLFLEVPCIDRVFESGRTVDFFYEHNSHFSSASLRCLLTRSHARIDLLERGYEDEVVYGYARLGIHDAGRKTTQEALSFFTKAQEVDRKVCEQLDVLAASEKRIAIWGGTGKAAMFINRYGLDLNRFPTVIDSDAAKAGTYVPGTGQLIQSPEILLNQQPVDVIVIATQWRAQDIALEIQRRGLVCAQLLLEYQGQLVDFYQDEHPYRPAFETNFREF